MLILKYKPFVLVADNANLIQTSKTLDERQFEQGFFAVVYSIKQDYQRDKLKGRQKAI